MLTASFEREREREFIKSRKELNSVIMFSIAYSPDLGNEGWIDLCQEIMWFLGVRSDPQSKITLKYIYIQFPFLWLLNLQ